MGEKFIRKAVSAVLALSIAAGVLDVGGRQVYAATAIYETKTSTRVTKGVILDEVRQVTDAGLLDFYVMTVPLDDPYISLGTAESKKEYGLKEPLTALLKDSGAVAGVNGDFFGLSGAYSLSFGPVVNSNGLVSVTTGINQTSNEYGAFYIDKNKNPFIDYFKTQITFTNNGKNNVRIQSINKVTDMEAAIIINRQAMADTAGIDARFPGIVKVVVEANSITYISKKGETVNVPQNGYLLAMSSKIADMAISNFAVGQSAELIVASGMDFSKVQMSIGGGGKILVNGETADDDGLVVKGRHPRTAVGITEDGGKIILITVDGRSHSIGATHEEMAELLKKYGAYNAMHLDGGGSATMAAKVIGDDTLQVKNTLSDGSQRKIINALGVYNNAPVGEMKHLVISTQEQRIMYKNAPIRLELYAMDDYYHKTPVNMDDVTMTVSDGAGYFYGDQFIPTQTGKIHLMASYGELFAEEVFECRNLMELRANTSLIKSMEGDRTSLYFFGVDDQGVESFIPSGVSYEIVPGGLGQMDYGTYVAQGVGVGYIKCTVGNISTYVGLQTGGRYEELYDFESNNGMQFTGYPNVVTGSVSYSSAEKAGGSSSALLRYDIPAAGVTQAAYLTFPQPLKITGEPIGLSMSVYGDNSSLWLRGIIKDAAGNDTYIDFTRDVDWTGWKNVYAQIPAGLQYPLTLERVYLVTLSNPEHMAGGIYIDNLAAVYPLEGVSAVLPESPKYVDPLKVNLDGPAAVGSLSITLLGKTTPNGANKPDNYDEVGKKALERFTRASQYGIYLGETALPTDIGIPLHRYQAAYSMQNKDNVAFIDMTAAKGSIVSTNPWQWGQLATDVKSNSGDHVVILMNKNPLAFSQAKETALFVETLAKLAEETGKNIFVVSTGGTQTASTIKSGVRYINMAGLWNNDGTVNENFRILSFRIDGKAIRYDLQGL